MRIAQSPPKVFLLAIGIVGIIIGILIAVYLAIPLQPPLNQVVQTSTSQQQGVVYVDMPIGVAQNLKLNYEPSNITVVIGINSTVVWRNLDTAIHTVTATDKSFDSGDIKGGASWNYTFTKPGKYDYYCVYHASWMKGTVVVKQSSVQPVKIVIQSNAGINQKLGYLPSNITVVIGVNNTVIWINQDNAKHTVTSNSMIFDSGDIASGSSWSYTFTTPGVYSYHCTYHSWMRGTVIVKSKP
jgi:plastocyanin